jgi:hypothetical protein
MREHMMAVQPEMMRQLIKHMRTGMTESMESSPMMKNIGPESRVKKPEKDEHSQRCPR